MSKLIKSFKTAPKYSIKWSNYFEIYENIFRKFVNKKITFVEIGIGDGGSLFMWKNFFGKKARIIGIELNPEAKKLEKFGFEIFIGNQSNPNFWENFFQEVGMVDIILDDGGHTNLDQIITTVECVKNINDGGLLLVEDTHTSYMKKYNSSMKYNFVNFSKKIIEDINSNTRMNFSLKKYIYSVQFYESMIVFNIDRSKTGINKQIISGKIDNQIKDLTWSANDEVLGKYKDLTKNKIVKNLIRFIKKKIINDKLKKFFY